MALPILPYRTNERRLPKATMTELTKCRGERSLTKLRRRRRTCQDAAKSSVKTAVLKAYRGTKAIYPLHVISFFTQRLYGLSRLLKPSSKRNDLMTFPQPCIFYCVPSSYILFNTLLQQQVQSVQMNTRYNPPPPRIYSIAECTLPPVARRARTFCDALVKPISCSCCQGHVSKSTVRV